LVHLGCALPPRVGGAALEATQFLTVAKPPRAAANTKMQ
jgi:hypothetical protein